ncbi:uncharacterized protein ACOB8E_007986 [Sarcophilus harrisii]
MRGNSRSRMHEWTQGLLQLWDSLKEGLRVGWQVQELSQLFSNPIPSHSVLSHPVQSCPIPSRPVPSQPVPSLPIPSHLVPGRPVPSCPAPSHPLHPHLTPSIPLLLGPSPTKPLLPCSRPSPCPRAALWDQLRHLSSPDLGSLTPAGPGSPGWRQWEILSKGTRTQASWYSAPQAGVGVGVQPGPATLERGESAPASSCRFLAGVGSTWAINSPHWSFSVWDSIHASVKSLQREEVACVTAGEALTWDHDVFFSRACQQKPLSPDWSQSWDLGQQGQEGKGLSCLLSLDVPITCSHKLCLPGFSWLGGGGAGQARIYLGASPGLSSNPEQESEIGGWGYIPAH